MCIRDGVLKVANRLPPARSAAAAILRHFFAGNGRTEAERDGRGRM